MAGIKRFAVMFFAASASFLSQLGERAGHRASMYQYEALRAVDHGLVELVGLVVAPAIVSTALRYIAVVAADLDKKVPHARSSVQ